MEENERYEAHVNKNILTPIVAPHVTLLHGVALSHSCRLDVQLLCKWHCTKWKQ